MEEPMYGECRVLAHESPSRYRRQCLAPLGLPVNVHSNCRGRRGTALDLLNAETRRLAAGGRRVGAKHRRDLRRRSTRRGRGRRVVGSLRDGRIGAGGLVGGRAVCVGPVVRGGAFFLPMM